MSLVEDQFLVGNGQLFLWVGSHSLPTIVPHNLTNCISASQLVALFCSSRCFATLSQSSLIELYTLYQTTTGKVGSQFNAFIGVLKSTFELLKLRISQAAIAEDCMAAGVFTQGRRVIESSILIILLSDTFVFFLLQLVVRHSCARQRGGYVPGGSNDKYR